MIEELKKMFGEAYSPELYEWLVQHNFFDCPASISHHGNEPGGLWEHSKLVALELQTLTEKLGLKWQRKESPSIVGLLHDVCKTDDYAKVIDEPGSEMFGGEVVGRTYKWVYNPEKFMDGHGDKSVIMLSSIIQLTEEEMFCIRFHMGSFTDSSQWKYYSGAVHKFPNVLYTHTADMLASQVSGV